MMDEDLAHYASPSITSFLFPCFEYSYIAFFEAIARFLLMFLVEQSGGFMHLLILPRGSACLSFSIVPFMFPSITFFFAVL